MRVLVCSLLISAVSAMHCLPGSAQSPVLRPPITKETEKFSLLQALNVGLAKNPRTSAARAQLGITESNLIQANVLPNPGLFIDNQYQFTYKLGASMIVEPPWRLIFRRAAAKTQITQTDLEITRVLWLFRGELRRAFVEAVIAREMVVVRKQLFEIMSRLKSIAQERFDKGDVPRLDVHRADLAVIQAEIQVEQADILLTQTVEQLNVLIAREGAFAEPVEITAVIDDILTTAKRLGAREQLLSLAHENRMELKIVDQQKIVNNANLKVARGNVLPAPRFSVGGMTEDKINSLLNRRTVFFQALIDLPILDRQQGIIAQAKARGKQLNFEYYSQKNIVDQQVLLAYRRLQSALARIEKYHKEALPVSAVISTAADLSYRMGQTDINSALVAQQDNILVRTQYLDSLLAYELAMNDLEQAVGIPLQ
jgi:cobalt-zinc-cadmium efflux system outer membrane protein